MSEEEGECKSYGTVSVVKPNIDVFNNPFGDKTFKRSRSPVRERSKSPVREKSKSDYTHRNYDDKQKYSHYHKKPRYDDGRPKKPYKSGPLKFTGIEDGKPKYKTTCASGKCGFFSELVETIIIDDRGVGIRIPATTDHGDYSTTITTGHTPAPIGQRVTQVTMRCKNRKNGCGRLFDHVYKQVGASNVVFTPELH